MFLEAESVSLALLGSILLFLPVSTKKMLSYCSSAIGAIIYIEVVDQLVHRLN